ncbi:hypothetical protein M885DRAFT_487214 [Pelagophyceae sp. CCMP2097]|nr:hypothetical protein M885DRAFT_487214 [Pelagophyceae sp. CCMP2097]
MVKTVKKGGIDLDAQIAALEAALGTSDPSSDGSDADDSDASSSDDSDDAVASKGGLIISSLSKARIPPLAAHLLPASKCKGSITSLDANGKTVFRPAPKKKSPVVDLAQKLVDAALTSTKNKVPFSCRLCAFTGAALEDFEKHKKTLLHGVATRLWTDQSYCRLCRAQCTSPLELRVHLTSKKHLERLSELAAANEAEAPPPLKQSRKA